MKINEYMKIKEAADFLGVTTQTLRNWEKTGKLKSFRHPMSNARLYKREQLEDVLASIKDRDGI